MCPIGDISVAIVISSEHRTESLQSVEFAINDLKKEVPIWKKEFYGGDSVSIENKDNSAWKENKEHTPVNT